jgi:hypothetical protein
MSIIHVARRRKVMVRKGRDWYSGLEGKCLWVNRKSVHVDSDGDKAYNLHFQNSGLEIKVKDVMIVPKFVRKFFHAINAELNIIPKDEAELLDSDPTPTVVGYAYF